MTWQCAACHQANPPGMKFCGHCGERRRADAAQALAASMAELAELFPKDRPGEHERPEERRLMTALFADVSGFTPLADRLDPEQLSEIIDPVLVRMGQIVERYDGHVHQYAGDCVLAYFGAPVAHEDDAVRALLAARDMHREVAEIVASLPRVAQHLTLHIGVNTGHVVTGFRGGRVGLDYHALGDAVNVAQRLEAASPSGEVYLGDLTYQLARNALQFESVGELAVKGKPEPVRAWRLVVDGVEAPAATSGPGAAATFGRDVEIAAIRSVLNTAAAGEAAVLALAGEPGVGKSRLMEEARGYARATDLRWEDTRCLSYGTSLAYRPYLDLVRRMADVGLDHAPDDVRTRVTSLAEDLGLVDDAAFLVHVAGVPSPDIPQSIRDNPQTLRHRVNEAIVGLLTALARREPVVLAIEDVHWIDSASLEVTGLLLNRSDGLPLCVAVSCRPEGVAAVEQFAGDTPARIVELTRLDPGAATELARAILGGPVEAQTMESLVARTAGNPLFLQEVVRSLVDAGALVQGPGGWAIDRQREAAEVPSSVESVLAARIDLLPREAADVLQVASVIGRNVRLVFLRELLSYGAAELDRLVDLLVEREFLDRVVEATEGRLVFHHALVVDVAYGRLLRRRRREIHRRLLEVGLRLYGDGDDVIDLVARNAYLAGMGPDALPYITRAADRATALFANAEAMTYLRQAVEIADEAGLEAVGAGARAELLVQLAALERLTGDYESALGHYQQVRATTDDLRAYVGLAATLCKLGRYDESLATIAEAERSHPDQTPEQRAEFAVQQALALAPIASLNQAVDVLTSALVGVDGSDRPVEAELLLNLSLAEMRVGEYPPALQHGARAVALLEAQGNLPRLATALRVLGGATADASDGEEQQQNAAAILERALEVARRVGNAEDEAAALTNLGRVLMDLGRADEALKCDRDAIDAFAGIGIQAGVACAFVNLSDKLSRLGRFDEAEVAAVNGLAAARAIHHAIWTADATAALGRVDMERGDYERARQRLDEATAGFAELGMKDKVEWLTGLSNELQEKMAAQQG